MIKKIFFYIKKMFTKAKDTDRKILNYLSDRDLFSVCLTDKYFNELCNDEVFWSERFLSIFGRHAAQYKPQDRTWRNHYIKVVRDINFLNNGTVEEWDGEFVGSYNWWFFRLIDWQLADGIKILSFPYEKYSLNTTKRDILFKKNSTFNSYVANFEEGKSVEESGEISQNIYWLSYLAGDKLKISIHESPAVEYTLDYFRGKDGGMWDYPKYFTPAKVVKIINDHFDRKLTLEEIERAADVEGDILEEMEPGVSTLKDLTLLINPTIQFIDALVEEDYISFSRPVSPENLSVLIRFD